MKHMHTHLIKKKRMLQMNITLFYAADEDNIILYHKMFDYLALNIQIKKVKNHSKNAKHFCGVNFQVETLANAVIGVMVRKRQNF